MRTQQFVGGWNSHTKDYVLSIQNYCANDGVTTIHLSLMKMFKVGQAFLVINLTFVTSLNSIFYSFNDGKLYGNIIVGNYGNFMEQLIILMLL